MKTKKREGKVPGTVFNNNGYWYWAVQLPGEKSRRKRPLRMPGAKHAMSADRPKEEAVEAAWREWEKATHTGKKRPEGRTVNDICDAWGRHAIEYYKDADGKPTTEAQTVQIAVRMFRSMYGTEFVGDLGHEKMLALRDALVRSGISRGCVNRYLAITKRMLTWALDENLISAQVKAELTQVSPLKRGRSEAPETSPVRAIDDATIEKTLEHMVADTADMVRVHRLTGMRPEEICGLTFAKIDTSRTPWVYRPGDHKNAWRGLPRVVLIGPRAREILERHRGRAYCFSPIAAVLQLVALKRAEAVSPSKVCRADPHAMRKPGEKWTTCSYTKTIQAACARAKVIPPWSANQLRHAFATEVRRKFGLEACRAVLGHSANVSVTDRYSFEAIEDETIRIAAPAVEALG